MDLPLMPPVPPMLARSAAALPPDASYEPKWDGFRAVVFRDGDEVVIGSRTSKPLTRWFPELVEAFAAALPRRCVLDGEIVLAQGGRLDFEALGARIHPAASRIALLAATTPASFVAFDALVLDDADLTGSPLHHRRSLLEEALAFDVGPGRGPDGRRVHLSPATADEAVARRWFAELEGAGCDGIVAKDPQGRYEPGRRGWTKVKHERTADCVVAGFRVHKGTQDAVGSLLLGLHGPAPSGGGGDGTLVAVGVTSAFTAVRRRELFAELAPLVTSHHDHPWGEAAGAGARTPQAGAGSRWNGGRDLSFVPLRPERVAEVAYDHLEGDRFRHTTQFRRWRPDRDPASCTYAQLEVPLAVGLDELVPGLG